MQRDLRKSATLPYRLQRSHSAKVIDGLYIGSVKAVTDDEWLENHRIKFIVKCDAESTTVHETIDTHVIDNFLDRDWAGYLQSNDPDDIMQFIQEAVTIVQKINPAAEAIHERISRGHNVLVHCWAGINRSALTIAWYLKNYRGMPYEDIVHLLTHANSTRNLPALFNNTFRHIVKNLDAGVKN